MRGYCTTSSDIVSRQRQNLQLLTQLRKLRVGGHERGPRTHGQFRRKAIRQPQLVLNSHVRGAQRGLLVHCDRFRNLTGFIDARKSPLMPEETSQYVDYLDQIHDGYAQSCSPHLCLPDQVINDVCSGRVAE